MHVRTVPARLTHGRAPPREHERDRRPVLLLPSPRQSLGRAWRADPIFGGSVAPRLVDAGVLRHGMCVVPCFAGTVRSPDRVAGRSSCARAVVAVEPALPVSRASSGSRPRTSTAIPRVALLEETPRRTRGLANAGADHGGHDTRAESSRAPTRRRSCGREGSSARGPRRDRQSPAGQRRSPGGWRRTRPQTEPAESEERDPPTGPARHRLRAGVHSPRRGPRRPSTRRMEDPRPR